MALGLTPIPNIATFNNGIPTASGYSGVGLDKYQQQVISWLDIVQRVAGLTFNKRAMWRRFQFTTANNGANATMISDYVLNNVTIEGFRANSFWNVTYGAGPGNAITVIPYENFMRMYARPDIVPIGAPMWLAPLPDDGSGTVVVRLNPIPDQTYVIEGQCRVIVKPIATGNDETIFPLPYEHGLITKTVEIIENRLDEGRGPTFTVYAHEFMQEIMRDAAGAEEETDQWDPGFALWNRWRSESARDFNPATDTAPPYP